MTEIIVVTPSFNAHETIDRTILSVASQAGNFAIRYHVQDGGSTDGTVERLKYWQKRLHRRELPIQCENLTFTWSSESDQGMYDALVRGFDQQPGPSDQFMTWINADDVLLTGALAFVAEVHRQFPPEWASWLGGAVAIMKNDLIIDSHDRPLPSAAIRAGLCDGKHWPFVQQEGVFFRRWLWDAAGASRILPSFRLAGDWALWQRFAQKASLVQARIPLGAFSLCEGQLSASQRESYMAEIEGAIPSENRDAALRDLLRAPDVRCRTLESRYPDGLLSLFEESVRGEAVARYTSCFGTAPPPVESLTTKPRTCLRVGAGPAPTAPKPRHAGGGDTGRPLVRMPGIIGIDADWQFPAITEEHAFRRLAGIGTDLPRGPLYVAFPWATLIDKLQVGAGDARDLMAALEQICDLLPADRRKVTVCQHILARKYQHLFRKAGIADVFWSHATLADTKPSAHKAHGPRFHPFPLYPVQTPEALPEAACEADATPRRHLFSFVGARADKFYLTPSRNWILDLLSDDPRGYIRGRDGWHYQRVVYDQQILRTADAPAAPLIDTTASDEFREALTGSVFALCPSGTGPNSIRLWESLAAGTIPVILADGWAPPGDRRLWDQAAVFCAETPDAIRALPDRLAAIAADPQRVAAMRHAMRQLWLLYGPPSFVTDLLGHILAGGSDEEQDLDQGEALLVQWSGRLLLDPAAALDELAASDDLITALAAERARSIAPRIGRHFDAVLHRALTVTRRALPGLTPADPPGQGEGRHPSPAIRRIHAPRVCLFGRHAHRTPMAYDVFRRHIGNRVELVLDPESADLIVAGFDLDFRENASRIAALAGASAGPRLAVISEEPLWDITWSGAPQGRRNGFTRGEIGLDYAHLAHGTSEIFDFEHLPYYPLTEDRFVTRYASLIGRQAERKPADLLAHWQTVPLRSAFIAEHRTGANYDHDRPEGEVVRLSGYRTALAERMREQGALCLGKGWTAETRRQDLPDWHLDKLAWVHDRCLLLGAHENIHLGCYISEKVFDAFACGSVPIYFAGPHHRILELVPQQAMVNTYGCDVEQATRRLTDFSPDLVLAEAWHETARRLAALFGDLRIIEAERARIADAVVTEVMCHV